MKDPRNEEKILQLHPKARDFFRSFIEEAEASLDLTLLIVQGLRSFSQQQAIYNQGRTVSGAIVTKAKPGQSYHNYGLAIDVVPLKGGALNWEYDFEKLAPIAEKHEITWGGAWTTPDADHFELKFGHTWKELLTKYQNGNFIEGTKYVVI